MLVEDDNNLREIYEARLLAEGYEIISAKDGEEALALAVKEKPDLIISDVMMPKISGFDMLDILRSTPETKNTKVIMMTALSQAEDKARADKLGADRYLVKSQVTLEDVAKVARDFLQEDHHSSSPVAPKSVDPTPPNAVASTPPTKSDDSSQPTTTTPPVLTNNKAADPQPSVTTSNDATVTPAVNDDTTDDNGASVPAFSPTTGAPTNDSTQDPITTTTNDNTTNIADSAKTEENIVTNQIKDFVSSQPSEPIAQDQTTTTASPPLVPQEPREESLEGETAIQDKTPSQEEIKKIEVKMSPDDEQLDNTNAASVTAEKLATAVNNLMDNENNTGRTNAKSVDDPQTNKNDNGDNPSAHKKIISPINDLSAKGPNLNELLEKEQKEGLSEPIKPPTNSIIPPGSQSGASISSTSDTASQAPIDTAHGDNPGNISI